MRRKWMCLYFFKKENDWHNPYRQVKDKWTNIELTIELTYCDEAKQLST